jgi:molecular chaperone GrpE
MSKKEQNEEEILEEVSEEVTDAECEVEETKEKTREEELEEQLAQTKDSLLRTAAEYANYRTRSAKEKEQSFSNAKGTVVAEILPVIDNLERAISSDKPDYEALKKGVEMTLEGLMASLEKLGVEQYGESGDKFDPNLHNAVMHIEDEGLDENVITDVFQKGYKVGDRVIRPAMVKTAN